MVRGQIMIIDSVIGGVDVILGYRIILPVLKICLLCCPYRRYWTEIL